jgi:radical SAM superfamily enzyme YgiQ (UPF0313 family)
MKITLSYNGDNDGLTYPPIFPLMLGNELVKAGIDVEIVQDIENYDYLGIPSDSIYRLEYQRLIRVIEAITGNKLDFKDFEVDYDWSPHFDVAGVLTSIGCVHKCKFCPQREMGYTERPIDKVLKELKWVTDRYDYFEFLDNNILANVNRFIEITNHVPKGVKWGALMNLEKVNEEVLMKLKDNGLINIYLGIESFNKSDLEYFGKPYYFKGIDPKVSMEKLLELGFNLHVFLIRGLPNETVESFNEQLNWLDERNISYTISRFYVEGEMVKETKFLSKEYLAQKYDEDMKITQENLRKFITKVYRALV